MGTALAQPPMLCLMEVAGFFGGLGVFLLVRELMS